MSQEQSVSPAGRRDCSWCKASLPAEKRPHSKFCCKRCRQSSWRFGVCRTSAVATDRPMRFAYADPPYPGKSFYYPEKTEVDHVSLIDRLTTHYPDGWALSTSAKALRDILPMCPADVRVCAWFKGPRPTKSRAALSSWEPIILRGGRPLSTESVCRIQDGLIARGRFRCFPGALIGMKPPAFSEWIFEMLGAAPGDSLDDLFPGSGAVSIAWARFTGEVSR